MPDILTPVPAAPAAVPPQSSGSRATLLDAEKLQVYRLAVEFQALAARLVPRHRGVLLATLRDQLDRASVSIVLISPREPAASLRRTRLASTPSPAAAPPNAAHSWISCRRAT